MSSLNFHPTTSHFESLYYSLYLAFSIPTFQFLRVNRKAELTISVSDKDLWPYSTIAHSTHLRRYHQDRPPQNIIIFLTVKTLNLIITKCHIFTKLSPYWVTSLPNISIGNLSLSKPPLGELSLGDLSLGESILSLPFLRVSGRAKLPTLGSRWRSHDNITELFTI